jgi:phosphatidate cytidylyltransferase
VLKRTAIGLALLLIVVGAWWWDHRRPDQPALASSLLAAVLTIGALDELQRFAGATPLRRMVGRLCGVAWLALIVLAALRPNAFTTRIGRLLLAASVLAGAAIVAHLPRGPGPAVDRLAQRLWFQLPYVGGLALILGLLLTGGLDYCVVVTLVAKASDTGAYFTGKLLGKHKLAPVISPNKTWEGAVGGLLLPALMGAWLLPGVVIRPAATAAAAGVAVPHDALLGACMGLALGALAILADLSESLLKRSRGVKDSSTLLGPAGGMLDLVDTLLLVGPIAVGYAAALT